jgi:hypothetical protein
MDRERRSLTGAVAEAIIRPVWKTMGHTRLRNRFILLSAVLWTGLSSADSAGIQERVQRPGSEASAAYRFVAAEAGTLDLEADRLARRLKRFRTIGDIENAQKAFRMLFPEGDPDDPRASLHLEGIPSPGLIEDPDVREKPWTPAGQGVPVFHSPDNERNPSMDLGATIDGRPPVIMAAEQWAGGWPRAIRIKKSTDLGETWTSSLSLGDEYPLTAPSIRRISGTDMGLVFTRSRHHGDQDVYFARISEDLSLSGVHPVAYGPLPQTSPALASDHERFASPYIYVVYAERSGPLHSVKFKVSPDLGETWSLPVTVGAFTAPAGIDCRPVIAFDPFDSTLTVAYPAWQGISEGIAVSRSESLGARWSTPVFITAPDSQFDGLPSIAAGGGICLVAYERRESPSDRDIRYAYVRSRGSAWIAGGILAAGIPDQRSPDVRVSGGSSPLRIYVSYVLDGSAIVTRWSAAHDPDSWSEEIVLKRDLRPVDSGPVALLPIGQGEETWGAVAWAEKNPDDDIYFSAEPIRLLATAELTVDPGNQDVGYTAGTTTFSVQKTGPGQVSWTASVTEGNDWLSIQSGASGLNAGTIVAAYTENPGPAERRGTIRVTPADETIPPIDVTVTQAGAPELAVTPEDGLASAGEVGGPFTPSSLIYTLENTGGTSLDWTAAKTQAWVTLSATEGTLAPGAATMLTVSINDDAGALAAGTYADSVMFTNTTSGGGSTTRPVELTVEPPAGTLRVAPTTGLTANGPAGGPFVPESASYTLDNIGVTALEWTATNSAAWVTLSGASGTLAPGETSTVTVTINSNADALGAGTYDDTVAFTNVTNGSGSTTRPVSLTVEPPPGVLTVTPATGLTASGIAGGPFTPAEAVYTLHNDGGTSLAWTAANAQAWVTLSGASGTLAPGETSTVTVTINSNADALGAGTYDDTVAFTNATNGSGSTTRPVELTVIPPPTLSVSPANRDVTATAGTTAFSVANTGGGTFAWTAQVISGGDWLSIQSGAAGTDSGTIVAAFVINPGVTSRQGAIRVTAPGAAESPKDVAVTQAGGYLTLTLSGRRLVEKAWIVQREYGELTLTIDKSPSILVDRYVIFRSSADHGEQMLAEIPGSSVEDGVLVYNDTFLEEGTVYTYRIVAFDSLGEIIRESNSIVI